MLLQSLLSCNNPGTDVISNIQPEAENIKMTSVLSKYPLLTWLRKTPAEIGCILEKEFDYRDSIFNCDNKNYVNKGDPCKNTDEYYEGINFPDELASKTDPAIKTITFSFEHGNLRELMLTFQDSLLKSHIMQKFDIPASKAEFPANIIEIHFGENFFSNGKPVDTAYTKWLVISGFEHIGSGDIDCN